MHAVNWAKTKISPLPTPFHPFRIGDDGLTIEVQPVAGPIIIAVMKTNRTGIAVALGAAALFGASTPFAKMLLTDVGPWLLAGLLYLGSGIGLTIVRLIRGAKGDALTRSDWPWMVGAVAQAVGSARRQASN